MTSYVGSRFGQDGPPRIATSTEMLLEATELPPIPTYQPLVPFLPVSITTGGSAAAYTTMDSGTLLWRRTPSRCDLMFYQGDDVVIPFFFENPDDPNLDMSDQEGFEWTAQVRTLHTYRSRLVTTFSIESSWEAPTPPDDTLGTTEVDMFLPRFKNEEAGLFRWDLFSVSPYDFTRFPKPDDVDPADWPPTTTLRTWLYGLVKIAPRVTSTDFLPDTSGLGGGTNETTIAIVTNAGKVIGPNGMVP